MMEARIEEEIIAQTMMADHQERSNKKRGERILPTVNFSSSKRRMPGDEADGAWCTWGGLNLVANGGNSSGNVASDEWRQVANGFTLGGIDELIEAAQCGAKEAQGSGARAVGAPSQPDASVNSQERHGSCSPIESHSQDLKQRVRRAIEQFLRDRGSSCVVGDLGDVLWDVLMILEKDHCCRPRTTTGGKSIFPLLVSGHPMVTGHDAGFLRLLAACLNSMYGLPGGDRGRPSYGH